MSCVVCVWVFVRGASDIVVVIVSAIVMIREGVGGSMGRWVGRSVGLGGME